MDEVCGAAARSGDGDSFAEEGSAFKPGQGIAQRNDSADDEEYGGFEIFSCAGFGYGVERGGDGALFFERAGLDRSGGCVGCAADADEFGGDVGHGTQAHVNGECSFEVEAVEFDGVVFFVWVEAAGDEGYAGGCAAVGDGDACVGRDGDAGGDAWDDFEGDVVRSEDARLLAAAPMPRKPLIASLSWPGSR